ncbi:MAG: NAD-binding protein [Deltaproteobacteria bacterium]|nr:NAD-binding protein [Deltaproteobacteria bacterium]
MARTRPIVVNLCLALILSAAPGLASAAGPDKASKAVWRQVSRTLIRHPLLSLSAVAKRLDPAKVGKSLDAPALQRLIDQHGGRRAMAKARDRALAEQLVAKRSKLEHLSSLRSVARALEGELAGLKDHNLVRLQDRHTDILGWLPRQLNAKSMDKRARARIETIALEHPTSSDATLAQLFSRDNLLKELRHWDAKQVDYLRRQSKIVPSDARRRAVVIAGAIETLHLLSNETTLEQGAKKVAARFSGVSPIKLLQLGTQNPQLAREVLRLLQPALATTPHTPESLITQKVLDSILFSERLTADLLSHPDAELPSKIEAAARDLAAKVGYRSTALSPRDVGRAKDPLLRAVLAVAHHQLGVRTLDIAQDLHPRLPALLARVMVECRTDSCQGKKQRALSRQTTRDALKVLLSRYQDEVHGAKRSETVFINALSLTPGEWHRMSSVLPAAAWKPPPRFSDEHLNLAAQLYAKVLAGSITAGRFYVRAQLTADELKLLRVADPQRFPKPDKTPNYRAISGRRHVVQTTTLNVPSLGRDWRLRVVSGKIGVNQFRREHNLSAGQLELLRANKEAFPSVIKRNHPRQARYVGRLARVLYGRDILLKAEDLVALINKRERYHARYGTLTKNRYTNLRTLLEGRGFPNLADIPAKNAALVQEIQQLQLDAGGTLQPVDIKRLMRERHPRFKASRYDQLVKAGLIAKQERDITPKNQRLEDAKLLSRMMAKTDAPIIASIAASLRAAGMQRFSRDYAYRLRGEFKGLLFSGGGIAQGKRHSFRINTTLVDLYALAARLMPPGTGHKELKRAFNRLLIERGLPAYEGTDMSAIETRYRTRYGSLQAYQARRVAEVVREYVATASDMESGAQILARMCHDYPSINKTQLSIYRSMWRQHPKDYPQLLPLFQRGKLVISKRRAGPAPQLKRFVGGWDVQRALIEPAKGDPALERELAKASHVARLRYQMPLIDATLKRFGQGKPLKSRNVLMVGHLLGTTVALTRALLSAGASANNVTIVGSPYGSHAVVTQALKGEGIKDVSVSKLDANAYARAVEEAMDRMVKKHLANHQPIVVLDDGGLVSQILAKSKYERVRSAFRVVEQTTGGETLLQKQGVRAPTLSIARCWSKRMEAIFIARTATKKIEQAMGRAKLGSLSEKKVTVIGGGGVLGLRVAKTLRRRGCDVTIIESSTDGRSEARRAGFNHVYSSEPKARLLGLKNADLVIGTTGNTSLEMADLRQMKNGAALVSVSSKQIEFPIAELARHAQRKVIGSSPHVRLPTARYSLGVKQLIVLGDGWPINFDGDVHSVPAEQIQLTRALMLAAALQIAKVKSNHLVTRKVHELTRSTDRWISHTFRKMLRRTKTVAGDIDDPTRWAETLLSVARVISP